MYKWLDYGGNLGVIQVGYSVWLATMQAITYFKNAQLESLQAHQS